MILVQKVCKITYFFSYNIMVIIINDLITYYYGLSDFNIYKLSKKNIVKWKEKSFYLEEVSDFDQVYQQYNITFENPYFYKFIFNKENSIITNYNNKNYVLIEVNDKLRLSKYISIPLNQTIKLSWRDLWIEKSDFIENYYSKIRNNNSLVNESFDYYLGLLELAIFYLNNYVNYYGYAYIQHKLFNYDDLYNPLNIKIDVKERDFAEYLKYIFINNEYNNINISELLRNNKDIYDFNLVIARVIYPNYYFDLLDEIIDGNETETILNGLIIRSLEFEKYVNNIIEEVSLFYPIKKISFMRF